MLHVERVEHAPLRPLTVACLLSSDRLLYVLLGFWGGSGLRGGC
jgi:hypothetical protein